MLDGHREKYELLYMKFFSSILFCKEKNEFSGLDGWVVILGIWQTLYDVFLVDKQKKARF